MAIKKEKFFKIINEVSKSEGLNKDNLLERIGSELKGINPGAYSTYNNLKIDKLFMIQDSNKTVNCMLLHLAVECNSVPIVKLLLEKKVKVDEQMSGDVNSEFTALHIAASHGHQEIVQLLLNNNANPSLKDSQGRTPRDIVGDVKDKKAIIKMLEAASSLTRDNENTKASVVERVRVLEGRQKENNNENNTDKVDDTLEREQAIRERDAMAQKLKEAEQRLANNKKRIEQTGHNQHSEQYGATYNGEQTSLDLTTDESSNDSGIYFDADESEALGQSILENGEDINAQDENGLTRLHYAAANNCKELAKLLIEHGANVNAQDKVEYTPLYYALANDNKKLAKLLIKHGADRSLIKDEGLIIDRLNSMCGQLPEAVPSTSSHSETHNATETPEEAERVKKSKVKSKELRAQLKGENESLKQKIKSLENENTKLKGELEKTKTKTNEVPLEKAQKELAELRNYVTEHGTRLGALNKLDEENESLRQEIENLKNENTTLKGELGKTKTKTNEAQKELTGLRNCVTEHGTRLEALNKLNEENQSLKQKIKNLENENTTLKGELGKTKTKTNEVSLEKTGKRQMSFLKVASVNLVTMLTVGATLSIAFDLSVLPIIVVFVTSAALLASCVTYAISKPIAEPKPTTELKEVDIQGSAQRCL